MGKPTLRQQIRDLTETCAQKDLELIQQRAEIADLTLIHQLQIGDERRERNHEQVMRVAAQNGLTPYVYAIQALNRWLAERPEMSANLEPILRELGLWGVEVGYDPNKDLALSIISPSRFNGNRG